MAEAYRIFAALFLLASPYMLYRFFADIYGSGGHQRAIFVAAFRAHPFVMATTVLIPFVAVFVALLLIVLRFIIDLFLPSYITGTLQVEEKSLVRLTLGHSSLKPDVRSAEG